MTQYIYLLQTREFVNSKEPIYKIGKTTKLNFTRFNQYPQGSVLLFQSSCFDCNKLEREIIQLFKSKYKVRRSIGRESFEGNSHEMIKDFCDFIKNEKNVIKNIEREEVVEEITEVISEVVVEKVIEEDEDAEVIFEEKIVDDTLKIYLDTTIKEINPTSEAKYIPKFCCRECNYFTDVKSNLQKHLKTSKHLLVITPESCELILTKNHCKVCHKYYTSQSGLWRHSRKCKVHKTVVPDISTIDLHNKVDNLKKIMIEIGKNIINSHIGL